MAPEQGGNFLKMGTLQFREPAWPLGTRVAGDMGREPLLGVPDKQGDGDRANSNASLEAPLSRSGMSLRLGSAQVPALQAGLRGAARISDRTQISEGSGPPGWAGDAKASFRDFRIGGAARVLLSAARPAGAIAVTRFLGTRLT